MLKNLFIMTIAGQLILSCQSNVVTNQKVFTQYAKTTLDSLYKYYYLPQKQLFNENFPKKDNEHVTYLANNETNPQDRYAYLWPSSGVFSGVNALIKNTNNEKYKKLLSEDIIPGLKCYYDTTRTPYSYQSYITSSGHSDRFYDDNIWLAIDFLEAFDLTGDNNYLEEAFHIWKFLMSGNDSILQGGIYWCEQNKESKNTCSNAPAAVLAFKLFELTKEKKYFEKGLELYNWTKKLQDSDYLYFDNIKLDGSISKSKYAYNTGQMIQAATLLYKITKNSSYLKEAQTMAQAAISYFSKPFKTNEDKNIMLFQGQDTWFIAIMMRGYVELFNVDKNPEYLRIYADNLEIAWNQGRYSNGLFNRDWSGRQQEKQQWLLNQAAMIEMFATLGQLDLK